MSLKVNNNHLWQNSHVVSTQPGLEQTQEQKDDSHTLFVVITHKRKWVKKKKVM